MVKIPRRFNADGSKLTTRVFGGPATQEPREVPELQVGFMFRVAWSNGAGYSVYQVMDDPGAGHHLFSLVQDVEAC